MRVLVCGSREWEDYYLIFNELANLHYQGYTELIEGGCRGADAHAKKAAKALGMSVITVEAEWEKYGKSAGYKRNLEMINMKPNIVLAFKRGESKGTQITIDLAKKQGIKTIIHYEYE